MEEKDKLQNIIYYLNNIKNINIKNFFDIHEYEEEFWKNNFENPWNKDLNQMVDWISKDIGIVKNSRKEEQWKNVDKSFRFPFPQGEEESKIIRGLLENCIVVKEGMKEKNYSIINIISYFLAQGKKILVTSAMEDSILKLIEKVPEGLREAFSRSEDNWEEDMVIGYCGKKYKLKNIKSWLKENEEQYSWIEDEIGIRKKPPITDAKFSRLIYLMSNTSREEMDKFYKLGSVLYSIPSYEEFLYKIEKFHSIGKNYDTYKHCIKDWCISYNSQYDYQYIIKLLDNAKKFLEDVEGSWFNNILDSSKRGEAIKQVLQQTILKSNYYIKKIASIKKEIHGHSVEIPKDISIDTLSHKLEVVYKQYEQKGKLNSLFKIFHSEYESLLERCKVDNKPLEDKERIRIAKLYTELCGIETSLKNLWNNTMKEYQGIEIKELNLQTLSYLEEAINKIDIIISWDKQFIGKITSYMSKITFLNDIDWYNKDSYDFLKRGIISIKYLSEYENLKAYIFNIKKVISSVRGFEKLITVIDTCNTLLLEKEYKKIQRLREASPIIKELEGLLDNLYKDCPELVEKILKDEDRINMLVKYKNFSVAWSWRQFSNIIREVEKNKTEEIDKSINSKLLWIMPINKIMENFKAEPDIFDLVIIDETLQNNIFAISALFRGKKILVASEHKLVKKIHKFHNKQGIA